MKGTITKAVTIFFKSERCNDLSKSTTCSHRKKEHSYIPCMCELHSEFQSCGSRWRPPFSFKICVLFADRTVHGLQILPYLQAAPTYGHPVGSPPATSSTTGPT